MWRVCLSLLAVGLVLQSPAPVTLVWDLHPSHDDVGGVRTIWEVEVAGRQYPCDTIEVTATDRRCTTRIPVPASVRVRGMSAYGTGGWSLPVTVGGPAGTRAGPFTIRWHRPISVQPIEEPKPVAWTKVFDDGFSGTEYTSLSGRTADILGGTWTLDQGNLRIGTGGGKVGAVVGRGRPSASIAANHAVELAVHVRSSWVGVVARYQTSSSEYNFQGYILEWNPTNLNIRRADGGSNNTAHWVTLGTASPSFTAGDVIRLEAVGDQLTALVNGSIVIGPVTDATFSTGSVALWNDNAFDNFGDDFKVYEEVAAPVGQPTIKRWAGIPHMGGRNAFARNGGGWN